MDIDTVKVFLNNYYYMLMTDERNLTNGLIFNEDFSDNMLYNMIDRNLFKRLYRLYTSQTTLKEKNDYLENLELLQNVINAKRSKLERYFDKILMKLDMFCSKNMRNPDVRELNSFIHNYFLDNRDSVFYRRTNKFRMEKSYLSKPKPDTV